MEEYMTELILPIAAAAVVVILSSLRVLREYERGVVFRLGRITRPKGPGLIFLLPLGVERMVKIPLRIVTMDIPPQDVITRAYDPLSRATRTTALSEWNTLMSLVMTFIA